MLIDNTSQVARPHNGVLVGLKREMIWCKLWQGEPQEHFDK